MTGCAYYASRVAFVNHYECVILLSEVANLLHRSYIAVHREYAVSTDDAETLCLCFLQTLLEFFHIGIGVTISLGLAETYTVDDRGVVECIRDDSVLVGQERSEQTSVSVEACSIQDGIFGLEIVRDSSLQLFVNVLGSADEANRRHAESATVHHFLGTLDKAWVIRQAKIVVGAEVEHLFALNLNGSLLWAFDDTLFFVETCLFEIFQCCAEMILDFSVHDLSVFKSYYMWFLLETCLTV